MTPLAAALAAALPRVFENRVVDGRGEDEETVDALADALRYATERGVRPDAQVALAVRLCGRRGDLGAVRAASVVRSLASTSLCHVRLSVSFFFAFIATGTAQRRALIGPECRHFQETANQSQESEGTFRFRQRVVTWPRFSSDYRV